jgi:hypothetical protein
MIISHKHRFIFIKTHKTAGSSLEMALAARCGPEDIITPMDSNRGTNIPRNFHGTAPLDRLYVQSRFTRKFINRHSPLLSAWYYEHIPAWRVREQIGEQVWNSYYKFCFERNPWDKVVSYYLWKKYGQHRNVPPFKEYVFKKAHHLPMDARLYFGDHDIMVDDVYFFESLPDQVQQLFHKLKLPAIDYLPREKTGIGTNRKPYQEYYDDESRAWIAKLYAKEIHMFNYTFL